MTKSRLHDILLITGIVILTSVMGIIGFMQTKDLQSNTTPMLEQDLFIPYAKQVSNGYFKNAYDNFLSNSYKSKFGYAAYKKAQELNLEKYGKLKSLKPLSGIFISEKSKGKWIYKGTLVYVGEKATQRITASIEIENGKYKFFRTYPSSVTMRDNIPLVY